MCFFTRSTHFFVRPIHGVFTGTRNHHTLWPESTHRVCGKSGKLELHHAQLAGWPLLTSLRRSSRSRTTTQQNTGVSICAPITCHSGESSHTAISRKVGFVNCDVRKRHVHGTDSIWNRTLEQELQECGRGLRFRRAERSNNFSGPLSVTDAAGKGRTRKRSREHRHNLSRGCCQRFPDETRRNATAHCP